ncbi:type II toxin-antitoxin system ParD family antitoxin [uncultured Sphingomonas sp.]|uniref:ribbon-helix-helix domain-containing protein n=1 Tax=uncultured Sphingomonas sp. TaxID=158754 RepID=UPI0035C9BCFB
MATPPLILPETALGWARLQVAAGKVASVEAYFVDLARRDQNEAEETAYLQAVIDEGLASGVDPRPAEQIFAEVRTKYFGRNG